MISRFSIVVKQALSLICISCAVNASFIVISCNNNKQSQQPADSTVYYPINNYIRQQVKLVDTTPYYLYRVLTANGKKDSGTISRPVFDSLAKQFLLPELEATVLKKNFTESVYEDESTASFTLSYIPKTKKSIVQNVLVLLDTASQNVKWIFINTLQNAGDSTIIQKIGWKGNESCYLNRSVSYPDGKENQVQLNLVWNNQ